MVCFKHAYNIIIVIFRFFKKCEIFEYELDANSALKNGFNFEELSRFWILGNSLDENLAWHVISNKLTF